MTLDPIKVLGPKGPGKRTGLACVYWGDKRGGVQSWAVSVRYSTTLMSFYSLFQRAQSILKARMFPRVCRTNVAASWRQKEGKDEGLSLR